MCKKWWARERNNGRGMAKPGTKVRKETVSSNG